MEGKEKCEKENEATSTCVQRANTLLNCLLSSHSMDECQKAYETFQNCCSSHNIVTIKLEGSESIEKSAVDDK